ncbi:unnamed protein product [Rhodiola kirilowii]
MKRNCSRKPKHTRKPKRISIIDYLPEDVLSQILSHLDHFDLKSTSLVCKLFCSLSSPLVRELTLGNSSDFQGLFKRFPCVKNIGIDNFLNLDKALLAISNSDLNLEKLHLPLFEHPQYPETPTIENMSMSSVIKGIKSLQLCWFHGTAPKLQIVKFINLFPAITELYITNAHIWEDKLIHKVTLKLPDLQKISLICYNIDNDETLAILSTNCPKLESVNFHGCWFSPEALFEFFCNNPKLSSVCMPDFNSPSIYRVSVVECMQVLKNLNHLSLKSDHLEDAVLIRLAELRPPLRSLVIGRSFSQRYTMAGLSRLLPAYPSLESLDIHLPHRKRKNCKTHDAELSIIVKRLPNLKHITVWSRIVCQATLFSLIENCPLLETVLLMSYSHHSEVYCDQGMARPIKKNYSIKLIAANIWLRLMVQSYCPNMWK